MLQDITNGAGHPIYSIIEIKCTGVQTSSYLIYPRILRVAYAANISKHFHIQP